MVKKILMGVGVAVLIVAGCVTTWFFTNKHAQGIIEGHVQEEAALQAKINAMGEPVVRYTVRTQVEPGTQLTADMLVEMNIPDKWVTDDYCTLPEIIGNSHVDEEGKVVADSGQFAKTYINPGTPITKSLLMNEPISNTLREIDVVANRWPIGLKVGDYVDIRVTYPLGEDFIVLSHKRVYEVNDQTLKLHMTEEEQQMYQSALVDYYLHLQNGMDIYFTKYIEPGVQKEAIPYYSVSANIAQVCLNNPNIVDTAFVTVKKNLSDIQRPASDPFDETQRTEAGYIRSGRDRLNSAVNSDYSTWKNAYDLEQEQKEQEAANNNNGSLIQGGVS